MTTDEALAGPARADRLRDHDARPTATSCWPGSGPTRCAATPTPSWPGAGCRAAGGSIGELLMDQKVLAGIGNVYRAEVLYRAGLSPFRPGTAVPREVFDAMWVDLRDLLRAGVRQRRIITTEREDRDRRSGTGPARGRALRLPPARAALPALRHRGAHPGDAAAQPVLVPDLPGGLDSEDHRAVRRPAERRRRRWRAACERAGPLLDDRARGGPGGQAGAAEQRRAEVGRRPAPGPARRRSGAQTAAVGPAGQPPAAGRSTGRRGRRRRARRRPRRRSGARRSARPTSSGRTHSASRSRGTGRPRLGEQVQQHVVDGHAARWCGSSGRGRAGSATAGRRRPGWRRPPRARAPRRRGRPGRSCRWWRTARSRRRLGDDALQRRTRRRGGAPGRAAGSAHQAVVAQVPAGRRPRRPGAAPGRSRAASGSTRRTPPRGTGRTNAAPRGTSADRPSAAGPYPYRW